MNFPFLIIFIGLLAEAAFASKNPCAAQMGLDFRSQVEIQIEEKYREAWSKNLDVEIQMVKQDLSGGEVKIQVLKNLGFEITNDKITPPTFKRFFVNYKNLIDRTRIHDRDKILPALPFYRVNSDSKVEYILISPGLDPWPTPESNFKLLPISLTFNLPNEVIASGLKRGLFPIMESLHDVFHFLGFIVSPKYMASLRRLAEDTPGALLAINPNIRMNYINEFLSLGDVNLRAVIGRVLLTPRNILNPKNFSSYTGYFDSLTDSKVLDHARYLANSYPGFLVDHGGVVNRSLEKISEGMGYRGRNTVFELFSDTKRDLSNTETLNRLWKESPSLYASVLNDLLDAYKARPTPETLKMIRIQVSRMEYVMWRSVNDMTVDRFVRGLILPNGSTDPEVAEFIRYGIGENSILFQALPSR